MTIPELSKCRNNNGLHAYKTITDNADVLVEVCVKCGDKKVYNRVNGKVDEKRYRECNARLILQPSSNRREFVKEFGYDFTKYGQKKI
jgi:hypothetical protein